MNILRICKESQGFPVVEVSYSPLGMYEIVATWYQGDRPYRYKKVYQERMFKDAMVNMLDLEDYLITELSNVYMDLL